MNSTLQKRLPQLGLVLVIFAFSLFLASRKADYLTLSTLGQLFKYFSPLAILALGMTFVILTGGIDLSVGFVMVLVMFVMAGLLRDHPGLSPFLAMGAGLGAALLIGGFIGSAVAYARIPSFIVSLAVMIAARGVTEFISHNQAIRGLPEPLLWLGKTDFTFLGASFPMMALVVVFAYGGGVLLLRRTAFGRRLYAVGSNREATRLSGVNVRRTEMAAYVLSALCVWVAAVMQVGLNQNADPKVALGDSLELKAIAIVVIGGTSLSGGRGSIAGTALGALLIALILDGLPFVGITEQSYAQMILGGIILLGALLDALQRRYLKE